MRANDLINNEGALFPDHIWHWRQSLDAWLDSYDTGIKMPGNWSTMITGRLEIVFKSIIRRRVTVSWRRSSLIWVKSIRAQYQHCQVYFSSRSVYMETYMWSAGNPKHEGRWSVLEWCSDQLEGALFPGTLREHQRDVPVFKLERKIQQSDKRLLLKVN